MSTLGKILFSIGKWITYSMGIMIMIFSLALGGFLKYRENANKQFINSSIVKAKDYVKLAKEKSDEVFKQVDLNSPNIKNIEQFKTKVQNESKKIADEINNNISKFDELKKSLQTEKQKINNQSLISQQQKNEINKAISDVENIIDAQKLKVLDVVSKINNEVNEILKTFNVQKIVNSAKKIKELANSYINFATNTFEKATEKNVNYYYDTTSNILLAVGGTVIGLIIIGTVLSFVFYKKVDKKIISRFNAKNDARKHIEKILKKYPSIINEL